MRLGVVDFLNAYPLWAALEGSPSIELIRGVPSYLAEELFAGRLDAALISSVEYLRHPEGFTYHPDLCIAAERKVWSIRLFVKQAGVDFSQQVKKLRRIYTDIASRSSVAQLRLILREHKAEIVLEEISNIDEKISVLADDEALLTIGDIALKNKARPSYDLQEEYYRVFGHGFVYALWVYRKALQDQLAPILDQAYADYARDQSTYFSAAQKRFGFSAEFAVEYLTRVIQHRLTAERRADLEFFKARLDQI